VSRAEEVNGQEDKELRNITTVNLETVVEAFLNIWDFYATAEISGYLEYQLLD
jgi:hypothetical protein